MIKLGPEVDNGSTIVSYVRGRADSVGGTDEQVVDIAVVIEQSLIQHILEVLHNIHYDLGVRYKKEVEALSPGASGVDYSFWLFNDPYWRIDGSLRNELGERLSGMVNRSTPTIDGMLRGDLQL